MASIAARGSKARPKLVCSIVPVALTTRIWPGRLSTKIAPSIRSTIASSLRSTARLPLPDLSAKLFEHRAALFRDIFPIVARQQRLAARMFEQTIDGWKFAQKSGGLIGHGKNRFTQGRSKFNMTFELEKLHLHFAYLTSANSFHRVLRSINIELRLEPRWIVLPKQKFPTKDVAKGSSIYCAAATKKRVS